MSLHLAEETENDLINSRKILAIETPRNTTVKDPQALSSQIKDLSHLTLKTHGNSENGRIKPWVLLVNRKSQGLQTHYQNSFESYRCSGLPLYVRHCLIGWGKRTIKYNPHLCEQAFEAIRRQQGCCGRNSSTSMDVRGASSFSSRIFSVSVYNHFCLPVPGFLICKAGVYLFIYFEI